MADTLLLYKAKAGHVSLDDVDVVNPQPHSLAKGFATDQIRRALTGYTFADGLSGVIWEYTFIEKDDYKTLLTKMGALTLASGVLSTPVTIFTLDENRDAWGVYYAQLEKPQNNTFYAFFNNLQLTFFDLVYVSAF